MSGWWRSPSSCRSSWSSSAARAIVNSALGLPDLLTYLLYVGVLIEPIQRYVNFARLYQEGVTGFDRFMDILEIAPDIRRRAECD